MTVAHDPTQDIARTRVNVGCGELPIMGWTNIDQHTTADIVGDATRMDFADLDEILCSHMLEHISWHEVPPFLARMRGWLKPGGLLTVEVPDLGAIMARPGPDWLTYIYGCQAHDGEYHKAGFTVETLGRLLDDAGYHSVVIRSFLSTHPYRPNMPVIEASANA